MVRATLSRGLACLVLAGLLAGCQSAYYGALESFGIEKRELLVSRIEAAQGSQQQAQEEFSSALEQFKSVVAFEGGELEDRYNALSRAYDRTRGQAADVRSRIDAVDDVGRALLAEWEDELDAYQDPNLRAQSADQLRGTTTRFETLVATMNRAADKMDPVLEVFEDQVLFLKHNLNARAVASLEDERSDIEARVAVLIEEMEEAIQEADRFISTMS